MSTSDLIRRAHAFGDVDGDAVFTDFPSLGALLTRRTEETPDAIFLRYFDDETGETAEFSYAQFTRKVKRAAAYLISMGLTRGDCVATLSTNHPMGAVLLFAGWTLGLIVAPQNVSEDDARIGFILRDAGVKLLIAHPELLSRGNALAATNDNVRAVTFDEMRADVRDEIPQIDLRRDPALLVYTSGTTGNSKGVLLTQYNLLMNARGTVEWYGIDRETCMMCVLPIHHVNGIVVTLLTTLFGGGRLILNRSFKVSTFWKRLADERVTIVSVVPTILQFLREANEDISARDLSYFRHFVCGAGTLAVSLVEQFEAQFAVTVLHVYGLSETTAITCSLPPSLTQTERRYWFSHYGYPSIGAVLPYCEMAIHDADGNALSTGTRGEIVIRGHFIMEGYFHRPDANAETFKHGWFRSGDEGFFERDANGRDYFFITGRLKEIINRGGVKYSPFEIEEVLLAIDGVKVGLAIAFDNDWYGEEIGAYVVRVDGATVTEADILAACRARMPFAKCPKVVVFGTEVPVTVTGKYQRLKLKPLFAAFAKIQFRG